MTPAAIHQAQLDKLSMAIADLDGDSRMIVAVNAFVYSNSNTVGVISSLAQLMVTLSACIGEDEIKLRCVKALRDAAALFEDSIEQKPYALK